MASTVTSKQTNARVDASRDNTTEDRLIQLTIEYTNKLRHLNKCLIEWFPKRTTDQFQAIYQEVKRLAPVSHDLAQALSQLIEHGKLESLEKLEFRLRLAELESSLNTSEQLLADYKSGYRWKV